MKTTNLITKKNTEKFLKFFLTMLWVSQHHPERSFAYRGFYKNIKSVSQTFFNDHKNQKIKVTDIEWFFDILLQIGAIEERAPYQHIKTVSSDKSNSYVHYVTAYMQNVRMFGLSQAFYGELASDGITQDMLDKLALMYQNDDQGTKLTARQLGKGVIILPAIQRMLDKQTQKIPLFDETTPSK